jgi:hypothetical protein
MRQYLLPISVALAISFCVVRLGFFVYKHTPPYSVGECVASSTYDGLVIKIIDNDLVRASSTIEITFITVKQKDEVLFSDLREIVDMKVKCP